MKKILALLLTLIFLTPAASSCFAEASNRKKIVVLATGGTIAGAGAGEFSEKWIEIIRELSIPVVISSRIDDGVITKDNLLCDNTVAANNLPPQKAAILLRLALTGDTSQEYLENLFLQY